jgi:hypothetical protein
MRLIKVKATNLLFLIIFALGCSQNKIQYTQTKECKEKIALCNIIRSRVAAQLKKEKKLSPIGFGGQAMDEVVMLSLSFINYKPLDIKESRELLIYCTDVFVDAVNKEERIHRYLKNYPFTPKNVEVAIFLRNSDGSTITSGLRIISADNGFLEYEVDNPDGPLPKTVLKETYLEALQKIESCEAEVKAQGP